MSFSRLDLYIPEAGSELTLIHDWEFVLPNGSTNISFAKKFGFYPIPVYISQPDINNIEAWITKDFFEKLEKFANFDSCSSLSGYDWQKSYEIERKTLEWFNANHRNEIIEKLKFVLPSGTKLSVESIVVNMNVNHASNISFKIISFPGKKIKGKFWVSLEEANKITCSIDI